MQHYKQYLINLKPYLIRYIKSFTIIDIDRHLEFANLPVSLGSSKYPVKVPDMDFASSQIFEAGITDSICRNLWTSCSDDSYYDALANDYQHVQSITQTRLLYGLNLYEMYDSLINQYSPSRIYLSHQSYDYYSSAYCAAVKNSVDVTLVHGGHQYMYDVKEPSRYGIGKDCPIKEIYEICNRDHMFQRSLEVHLQRHGNEASATTRIASTQGSKSLLSAMDKSVDYRCGDASLRPYIVVIPIFREIQIELNAQDNIFRLRKDWLEYTLKVLPDSRYIPIIIRIHPNSKDYGEEKRTISWIKYISSSRSNPFYITNGNTEFTGCLNSLRINPQECKWIMFQGSLSLELVSQGIKPICSVEPVSIKSVHYRPSVLSQYNYMLTTSFNPERASESDISLAKFMLSIDNSLTRGSKADRLFEEIDETYHFGKIKNQNSEAFISLLEKILKEVEAVPINTTSFVTYLLHI